MFKNKLENNRKLNFMINKIYHFIFSEKFSKKIKFNFDSRSRLDLIKHFIIKNNYKKYLEIGCHDDEVFKFIDIKKIGVDPISGGNFRGTSDEFFRRNDKNFDCVFIDGLHEYEQVKKDINNSLKYLNHNGIVILHDCLPPTINHQRVPRTRYTWNGDVWKAIVEARTKIDLDTYTVLADQGIGLIFKRKNTDLLVLKHNSFKKMKFKFFYENYKKIMRTINFDDCLKMS